MQKANLSDELWCPVLSDHSFLKSHRSQELNNVCFYLSVAVLLSTQWDLYSIKTMSHKLSVLIQAGMFIQTDYTHDANMTAVFEIILPVGTVVNLFS